MIIRSSPRRSYTALPNSIFRDTRLSLDTKGLLAYLLSLPPNWEIRTVVVARQLSPDGRRPIGKEKLQRMFAELQAAGYMARSDEQSHDEAGYFAGFVYIVGADPENVKEEATAQGLAVASSPQAALPSTAQPSAANPPTDKRKKDNNNIHTQTARPELAERDYGDAAVRGLPEGQPIRKPEPSARIAPRDQGALQVAIAERIGPTVTEGFDILYTLSTSRVDELCTLQRRGALDEKTIEQLRWHRFAVERPHSGPSP